LHWENQLRRHLKELEQAQQALFSARIGVLRKETVMEQMAVHRAKEATVSAEQKLRILKKWERDFDGRVQPLLKQIEKLHMVLSNDMVKAVAYLTQAIATLAAYNERPQQVPGSALTNSSTEPARGPAEPGPAMPESK